jgi:hypothetical protein
MTRTAEAANPAPVEVRLDAISSAVQAPAGTPPAAVPTVLAVPGDRLTLTVSFFDSSGRPAYFSKDTSLAVTSDDGPVVSIATVARKGKVTADLVVSMVRPANRVSLTVTVPSGKPPFGVTARADQRFDVLSELRLEDSRTGFRQGIGGQDNCAQATPEAPVCGVVILPQGASSPQVLLSLGPCDDRDYSGCGDPRGSVVQTLAGLDGYSATAPATMLVKCDKSLCGGGSIQSKVLNYALGGDDALTRAPACPAKGTVGAEPACVDYVQSQRDNSGDTFLYLLFVRDARVSVG